MSLTESLRGADDPDAVFTVFTDWVSGQGLTPYPAQVDALIEVVSGSNVIMATPTGSGKSLVATGLHAASLAVGQRSFYTAPVKALVSEKFFAATQTFGADQVGMMTGDAAVNTAAPIICCTAEVLAQLALREGRAAAIGSVVMDEFHYYADRERGWAWQVPLLELPRCQFLLMSATLGDVSRFETDLTRRTGRPTALITSAERPVPLHYSYVITPLHETITERLETHQAPMYVVYPSRAAAIEQASALVSLPVTTRTEKDAIAAMIGGFRFTSGFGKVLSRLVRHGIGVHHAGMLPKYRRLVEVLAQAGLLKIICGTDTLGVGVNVPIRTVIMTSLSKFDGERARLLSAREFHQIGGRAGRAGFDVAGYVVVQAPDHVVANERALAKAGDDPRKRRRVVRRKPPEGTVGYGRPTFERLVGAEPEPLESSFRVSHTMLLDVIARAGNCGEAMRHLLLDNDEPPLRQRSHVRRALAIYRSLRQTGVVERLPEPDAEGRWARLTVDLQPDFALNQPLSPFAVAALDLLDRDDPGYALDVVSVIEATLDDPTPVTWAQRDRARAEAVAAMKVEGIEYEERVERVAEITHPQPLAELLEVAYAAYAKNSPWLLDFRLAPKSVVREMAEQALSFGELISTYGLARSEGIVLRYLADSYKALRRTVPEPVRTAEVSDLISWLGELVRQVDSSLLDEWEALRDPHRAEPTDALGEEVPPVSRNARAFRVLVRNAMFRRVELAARRRWTDLGELDGAAGWDAERWAAALGPYFAEHDQILTGADARGPGLISIEEEPGRWTVTQILDDPAGDHDWRFVALVDLASSDEQGEPALQVMAVGALGAPGQLALGL